MIKQSNNKKLKTATQNILIPEVLDEGHTQLVRPNSRTLQVGIIIASRTLSLLQNSRSALKKASTHVYNVYI